MSTSLAVAADLATISGISTFFWIVVGIAVVAGAGVILKVPWPIRGLGIGLIVGALIIVAVIATGPAKP